MKKINAFIDKHSYVIAVILFTLALTIDVAVYAGNIIKNGFSAYLTVMFSFEIILHLFLIYALIRKNQKVGNVFMIAVKVFDAIFFSSIIAIKIDKVIADPSLKEMISRLDFVAYALSTILLIIILVFFIANNVTGKHKYWVVVKIAMLLTAVTMLVCSCFEIYNLVNHTSHWFAFLEPMYMSFLMLGMFTVCHYIEKER